MSLQCLCLSLLCCVLCVIGIQGWDVVLTPPSICTEVEDPCVGITNLDPCQSRPLLQLYFPHCCHAKNFILGHMTLLEFVVCQLSLFLKMIKL
jgi:hypothetical protein